MKEFLATNELSEYVSIKRSTLYSMVESGEITHCRGERLIRFRKQDIDTWMENDRIEGDNVNKKARGILRAMNKPVSNINSAEEFLIDENPKRLYIYTRCPCSSGG